MATSLGHFKPPIHVQLAKLAVCWSLIKTVIRADRFYTTIPKFKGAIISVSKLIDLPTI